MEIRKKNERWYFMKKQGFTLAEVLITLVIIGIIAAMTLPSLLGGTNKQEIKTGLQKAISVLSQTITLHYALTGEDFSTIGSPSDAKFKTYVANRFNLKEAYDGTTGNFTTADSIEYQFGTTFTGACTADRPCSLTVDVNGSKGPGSPNTDSETSLQDVKDQFKLYVYGTTVQAARYECQTPGNLDTCTSTPSTASKLLDGSLG